MDSVREQLTSLDEIALVSLVAVALGLGCMRLRQPPIVGYIIAGVLLGPTGFGVVQQSHSVETLAELGVLLLLFLIGMEISIRAFVLVLRPASLIAAGQIASALLITWGFGSIAGWNLQQIVLLGFIIAISSTAVTLKILEEIRELRTEVGRIAVGVMIAQDIAIVPMLIVADGFGGDGGSAFMLVARMVLAVGLLGGLIYYLAKPGKFRLPFTEVLEDKPDVIALGALAFCFTAATISSFLGLSPAYGAFIAGLVVANSTLRVEAIEVTYPIQSLFLFIFFLSIGLLIDLDYIVSHLLLVVTFTLGVILLKTVINVTLTRLVGLSLGVALTAGLSMSQVGEFSFVLAAVGLRNRILDADTYRLALSVIALSILLSPAWMAAARRFHDIARSGVSTYRLALAEAYGDELASLGERSAAFRRLHYRSRLYARALRKAWHRRQR
jgi:CPA2 family monovalent cation:H+ antiporter-2